MATIVKRPDPVYGCHKCEEYTDDLPVGYIWISNLDDKGIYFTIGRCYGCNHRDRKRR